MYEELKNQHPESEECFFAFSKIQLNEGIEKKKLQNKKILLGGLGLYGTKEGLDNFHQFYLDIKERIKNECKPQEIYDYEYYNHECKYTGDDTEAIEKVKYYFGDNGLVSLIRKKW